MDRPNAGRFVWYDLMSRDPERARAFYGDLLGWTFAEETSSGEPYWMVRSGEHGIGGVVPFEGPQGESSHWMPYIEVAELDACLGGLSAAGGSVCVPATPIQGHGRFAVVGDPQGAVVSVIELEQPSVLPGPGVLHVFCWAELNTSDPDGAAAFYARLFGWEYKVEEQPEVGTYRSALQHGQDFAGILRMQDDEQGRPYWLPYLEVRDVDATHARALELGAALYAAPADVPGTGRFSILADPTGAAFALFGSPAG